MYKGKYKESYYYYSELLIGEMVGDACAKQLILYFSIVILRCRQSERRKKHGTEKYAESVGDGSGK